MQPDTIRDLILTEHFDLREDAQIVGALCHLVRFGQSARVAELRQTTRRLISRIGAHLCFEDLHLAPALASVESGGIARACRFDSTHELQRSELVSIVDRLDDATLHPSVLACEIESFIDRLANALREEEASYLTAGALCETSTHVDAA